MRKELQYAFDSRIEDFGVTLSVGVSLFPKDGTDYEELSEKLINACTLQKKKDETDLLYIMKASMVHLRIIAGIFIKFLICLIIQNICLAWYLT